MKHINYSGWNSYLSLAVIIIGLLFFYTLFVRNNTKYLFSHRVFLPERVNKGITSTQKPYRAVLWISNKECTKCRINTLPAYLDFYESTRDSLDFLVIISSRNVSSFPRLVEDLCLPFPVYYDGANRFRLLNLQIPNESKYHFLLLDSFNHPVIIGDPVFNSDIYRIYARVLGLEENDQLQL